MKNILKISFIVLMCIASVSCKKDDSTSTSITLRDRQVVYDEDILEIEDYLNSYYLEVDGDLNATIKEIDNGQTSLWDDTTYPLQSVTVKNDVRKTNYVNGGSADVVEYKMYYIVLNEGGGVRPTQVDSVFTAYKGWDLKNNEIFDQNNQGIWFTYPQTGQFDPVSISGFRQILYQIKTEESSSLNGNGTITHNNYGNIIVFIPSGLAYFNTSIGGEAYNPIAFQIKLFQRKENDQDRDRVKSNYEDLNGDNDFYNDDSDGDNIPNFLDADDDNDGIITKVEIIETNDGNGHITYYSFGNIPFCSGGSVKKHLDNSCQ
ncbi:FKBP-type peptidyl-prolyl cis-trans isomerase [Flavobacterium sp. J27]|uniref:FKBP-type peptidyl-prolyl cis-trans isomerase n=1 Tax=Flavobacterium sp. J27 TaxID=2060419 RepID=UPI00102F31C4|nr:hypothetical protein [Flavobacterium sp. J27]